MLALDHSDRGAADAVKRTIHCILHFLIDSSDIHLATARETDLHHTLLIDSALRAVQVLDGDTHGANRAVKASERKPLPHSCAGRRCATTSNTTVPLCVTLRLLPLCV